MAIRVLKLSLLALLALYAALASVGEGGRIVGTLLHDGLMVAAAAICLVRAVRVKSERAAWTALTVALGTYALGEISWNLLYAGQEDPPFPSLSDAFWLVFYPASYVALVLLVRARVRSFHASLWLDGMIGALAVGALGSALLFDAVLGATEGNAATVGITLAYPLGDLLLLGIVVGVFALTGWRPGRSWSFIGSGLALNAVADALYSYRSAAGTWVDGSLFDVLFPAAALLLAYAAWQPSQPREIELDGNRLLVVPAVFAGLAFVLAVYLYAAGLNGLAAALTLATVAAILVRTGLTYVENIRILGRVREDSVTDALTGLSNRRALLDDLPEQIALATPTEPRALALFDLDGFKGYNDAFGHGAGDELLTRLGRNLRAAVAPAGGSYRLGGDEFCILVRTDAAPLESVLAAADSALAEEGEGFIVGSSRGVVLLPTEADDPTDALQLADQRMYAQKDGRSASARRQSRDVLLGVLRERAPEVHDSLYEVSRLAVAVGERMGMEPRALDELGRASELHDVGKMAIPDAILAKPGPLDATERAFVERHTLIGERILAAAPALRTAAKLVRSSHERMDGSGYPDRLAGEDIPLGARIIAVCDAFAAMTADRAYRRARPPEQAVHELRRCAGPRFDRAVVEAFVAALDADRDSPVAPPDSTVTA